MRRFSPLLLGVFLVILLAVVPRYRVADGQQTDPPNAPAEERAVSDEMRTWINDAAVQLEENLEKAEKEYHEFRVNNPHLLTDRDTLRQRMLDTEKRQKDTREEIEDLTARLELLRTREKRLETRGVELKEDIKKHLAFQTTDELMRSKIERLTSMYDQITQKVAEIDLHEATKGQ